MYAVSNRRHLARGLPQLPAACRRPGRHGRHVRVRQPDAPVPDPGGVRVRGRAVRRRGLEGHGRAGTRRVRRDPQKQAEYEISIICQMGFPAYFLVVADFINWAKNNGVAVGPGRGSRGGSIVAYAMGITDLDPLDARPDLRAVPEPRADLDARHRHRLRRARPRRRHPLRHAEVGRDKVAQIITYGTIKAKAAIKDSTRVLGFPYALGDRITKAFPPAGDGQGHPAGRHLRRGATPATARPATCATCTTPRPRSSRSSTRPRASRA